MSDVQSLLPPNASATTTAIEAVMAERTEGLSGLIAPLWNVETCPEALLPWLAWSFSVEVWDHTWPVKTKRSVIRQSFSVHRRKGTRLAVEEALGAIGVVADVVEWFEAVDPQPDPGTFAIWMDMAELINEGSDVVATLDQLRSAVDAAKPVSAHYTAHARMSAKAREFGGVAAFMSGGVISNTAGIPLIPAIMSYARSVVTSTMTGSFETPTLESPL